MAKTCLKNLSHRSYLCYGCLSCQNDDLDMVSTIHIKISQNLSPGRGVGRFFWGGGVKWFSEGTGRGISRRQLSIKVGLLTIYSQ